MPDILDCYDHLTDGKGKISTIELPKVPIEIHEYILDKGGTIILTYEVTEIENKSK